MTDVVYVTFTEDTARTDVDVVYEQREVKVGFAAYYVYVIARYIPIWNRLKAEVKKHESRRPDQQ